MEWHVLTPVLGWKPSPFPLGSVPDRRTLRGLRAPATLDLRCRRHAPPVGVPRASEPGPQSGVASQDLVPPRAHERHLPSAPRAADTWTACVRGGTAARQRADRPP